MDEKTLDALTFLATKLGTTSEYLWSALLRQAPIAGIADIILLVFFGAGLCWWEIFLIRKKTEYKYADEMTRRRLFWGIDAVAFGLATVIILSTLYFFMVVLSLNIIIASFANPKYWALKQIIK